MMQQPTSRPLMRSCSDLSHVAHKVPAGDTPYVRAKRVQLVDKDPNRAIGLFWAAINHGDRVDSALKDMAIVMKQQNRAEEAIEAIKSLRSRCSDQSQESLDNILLDLYKRCGRIDDQIALLKHKLRLIDRGLAFNGKRTKTARSQGRKFQVTVQQEATRLLGNLGWALMQKENYTEAEAAYRRALVIGPDNNKMCNLGICLMQQGRIVEAKEILMQVRPPSMNDPLRSDLLRGSDSHLKAFERAQEMLRDLEKRNTANWRFDTILGQSASIWQPQPCIDYMVPLSASVPVVEEKFTNKNCKPDLNRLNIDYMVPLSASVPVVEEKFVNENCKPDLNRLNVDAVPFYSSKMVKKCLDFGSENMPLGLSHLKRTRSIKDLQAGKGPLGSLVLIEKVERRRSIENRYPELPNTDEFDAALVEAVLGPLLEEETVKGCTTGTKGGTTGTKDLLPSSTGTKGGTTGTKDPLPSSTQSSPAMPEGKKLRIFQDITSSLNREV
ncbi:Protein POLLENLESS 3-LIKE 2 [Rhynchospora pubera]|uniref:Protein POLLENLESS 3-LIKE 2 n=1 Tax=Rhynchospora pubera TaxID=906938 RepID=A0AAV8GKU0_9POAL|nr:Protein POLLENLESS 3-LIKE 2 [Rhynchospora pubera]